MRGKTAQDDVILHHELQHFETFMRGKAIANQYSWFSICPLTGLRIKNTLEPF
jgi:hypothetical protein